MSGNNVTGHLIIGCLAYINSLNTLSNLLNYSHFTDEELQAIERQNEESNLASFTLNLNS